MSKKREDLEAILDLLHEYAEEYDEPHVTMFVLNGSGHAWATVNDLEVNIFKVYEKEPSDGNREGSGNY